jgi:antitoxin VapB
MATAKLFKNGRSQAVRLPKEFRFQGDEVCIKRVGSMVVLYQADKAWDLLDESLGRVTEDFMVRREQPEQSEQRLPL